MNLTDLRYELKTTKILTVLDVYGTSAPTIPEGYVVGGFRTLRKGDIWLSQIQSPQGFSVYHTAHDDPFTVRLILVPTRSLKRIVLQSTYEWRSLLAGEYFFNTYYKGFFVGPTVAEHEVFRVVEETGEFMPRN